jgi:hypothetical protein
VSACRGTVTGGNKSTETGTASRLGSRYVTVRANTWSTFATVTTCADGRVYFTVSDDDGLLLEVTVSAETDPPRSIDVYRPRAEHKES